jgi:hypothetical protein
MVFAPRASLFHFEALAGGCENRVVEDDVRLSRRLSLEYLFLNRLYSHDALLRALGPLGLMAREVIQAGSSDDRRRMVRLHGAGYLDGRRRYKAARRSAS